MKTIILLALAAAFATGCGDNSSKTSQTAATNAPDSSAASGPADYLGALARSKQTADKTIDTASIDKAIQLFQVDKGRLPKDLNELVTEKFMPQIPKPPVGMKFSYDATTGVVKVVPQ
jgi:ABC-type Fe3+-hydroxamate transport system substrate-binding protein